MHNQRLSLTTIPFALKHNRRALRPEDCGGVPGYYDLLEVPQNPDDERYEETRV
jgi:hypothetical protein